MLVEPSTTLQCGHQGWEAEPIDIAGALVEGVKAFDTETRIASLGTIGAKVSIKVLRCKRCGATY